MRPLLFLGFLTTVLGQQCPTPNGYFADRVQCDKYYECVDGVMSQHLCPDGLLYNEAITNNTNRYPCGYPADVDCGSRTQVQPAQPTQNCAHAWGYFGSPDKTQCGSYWNCVDGREFQFTCPEGLMFSSNTYRCEWLEDGPACDVRAFLGFSCPPASSPEARFLEASARYSSPRDCTKFFSCVESSPRIHGCERGHVFNEIIGDCDEPEKVQGCENHYSPEELAEIRQQRERARQFAARRLEELEQRKQELAQRRNG